MVAPASGNSQQFDVLLNFAVNEELFDEIEKKTSHIADETKRAQEMTRLYGEEIKKTYPDLYKQIEAERQAAEAMEKSKEAAKKYSVEIRNLRAQARAITSEVRLIRDQAEDLDRVFKPLALGGGLIVGSFLAFANKYVEGATEATQVTREWKAAQADLERSGQQVGEVLAREALPLLQEAAKVTRYLAGVLESHPEIAKATLYGGLLALAVGTIGKLYTQGLRLYADIKLDKAMALQFAAAELQLKASQNQLRAAGLQAEASGTKGLPTTGSNVGSKLGTIALYATAVTIGAELGTALGNKIGEAIAGGRTGLAGQGGFGVGDVIAGGVAASQTPSFIFARGLNRLGVISDETVEKMRVNQTEVVRFTAGLLGANKILNVIESLSPSKIEENLTQRPPSFLGGSRETQDKIVQAFSDWKQADAQIVQDAMEARKQIVADGEKAIVDITRNFTQQRAGIAAQFNSEAAQIAQRYQQETQKAEQDYQDERAQIVQDGNERIREIQEEEQEKREEIERDFAKAAAKAGADRDALALVQAQEARDEALAEAERGTQEAIAKERQETQQRLQELAVRYAQERLQRQQQYEQDLKENAIRRAQALKEAAERYQQELKQAREATAQKLKEAAEAANRERIERRQQFIAQLGDLGVTLNSERQLRVNAYNAMLADVTAWLNQMNAAFANATQSAGGIGSASGGTTTGLNSNPNFSGSGQYGTHDYSGYAYRGLYRMAQDGKPEWVMSGNDTRAAERAVGGQLTQQNVAQMISLMAAMRGSKEYVDNSVYGKDMTTRQIRDLKEDAARRLDRMLGNY